MQEQEPPRLYLSFRSNRDKDRAVKQSEKEILDLKKKYHLLYD